VDLVVLIGLQASGKSTFRRLRFDATHVVVSKDLLRGSRRPQIRQIALIEEALATGRSVVVDNTNPARDDRKPLVEAARRYGARVIGYFFPTAIEDSVRRNSRRRGRARVPVVALHATKKRLQVPDLSEGFDELHLVSISGEAGFDVRRFEGTRE